MYFLSCCFLFCIVKGRLACCRLTLDAAAADAGHDILPEEHEYQEQRSGDQCHGGHLHGVVDVACGVGKGVAQTVGDEAEILMVGNQSGPDIGVPGLTAPPSEALFDRMASRMPASSLPQL